MLLKYDDDLLLAQREADFQERVIAASLPHDPELFLAKAIFQDKFEEAQAEQNEDGEIVYPTTPEEFEQMIELFESYN